MYNTIGIYIFQYTFEEEYRMNRKIMMATMAALALSGGIFHVQAEEIPVYTLDSMVVTASRSEEKQLDSNADISVITARDIEEHHYNDVTQALRTVPGIFIDSRGAGSQSYNSDQIYINGSSNVVVLVDGIRRNTNGNTHSKHPLTEMVAMDSIDHIEVLRGSASTLYGSDAQGGVINIITKTAKEEGARTTLRTSFGSAGKEKYTLYNEGREGKIFWNVEAGKEIMGDYKDGWGRSVINHLNADHYNVKLGYDLGNDSNVVLNYEKYKSSYTKPELGSNTRTRVDGTKDNDALNLQYRAALSDRLTNVFSIYRNRNSFDIPSQPWGMEMKTTGISDQLTYRADRHTITGGFDWYKDEIPFYYDNTPASSVNGTHATNVAFYLQDKIDLTDQWNITPGVRVDHHSEFGTHTSPSLSIGFKENDRTNYYVNYKTFFVAPNLYQLHGSDAYFGHVGNENLKPEEGNTVEFGINHAFSDTLSGTFNVFHTHAKNLIYADPSQNYKYENSGKANINGFNLSLNKEFSTHWSAGIGYSYLHIPAKNEKQHINLDGSLPESILNVNVNYRADRFDASLTGRGVMNRYGRKKNPLMEDYANYWVWDLSANYELTRGTTLFARVNNLFDQFYTSVGTSSDPYGTWYSAQGRNFELGLQMQF